jgi:hypothetical protein
MTSRRSAASQPLTTCCCGALDASSSFESAVIRATSTSDWFAGGAEAVVTTAAIAMSTKPIARTISRGNGEVGVGGFTTADPPEGRIGSDVAVAGELGGEKVRLGVAEGVAEPGTCGARKSG